MKTLLLATLLATSFITTTATASSSSSSSNVRFSADVDEVCGIQVLNDGSIQFNSETSAKGVEFKLKSNAERYPKVTISDVSIEYYGKYDAGVDLREADLYWSFDGIEQNTNRDISSNLAADIRNGGVSHVLTVRSSTSKDMVAAGRYEVTAVLDINCTK